MPLQGKFRMLISSQIPVDKRGKERKESGFSVK